MQTKKRKSLMELDSIPEHTGPFVRVTNVPDKYVKDGYVQVAQYLLDHSPKVEKVVTRQDKKLQANRIEWERQYDHYLLRLHNFFFKLEGLGRDYKSSKKYAELRAHVDLYHAKLRETKPKFKS